MNVAGDRVQGIPPARQVPAQAISKRGERAGYDNPPRAPFVIAKIHDVLLSGRSDASTRQQARRSPQQDRKLCRPNRRHTAGHHDLPASLRHNRRLVIRHRHSGCETALPGVRGQGRERDHHGAPVVCARADQAPADRRPAVDPGRADRRPGAIGGHGAAAGPGVPHQGASWPSTSSPRRSPAGSGWTSSAGTRSMAPAPNCARST